MDKIAVKFRKTFLGKRCLSSSAVLLQESAIQVPTCCKQAVLILWISLVFTSIRSPTPQYFLSLLIKVLWCSSQLQCNWWLYYFCITDVILIMQFPVKVQLLNSVISTRSLTCLVLDAENIRHFTSPRPFEKWHFTDHCPTETCSKQQQCHLLGETAAKATVLLLPLWHASQRNDIVGETALITEVVSCMLTNRKTQKRWN